ncbi:MAG TPA: alpha/beta fold hydrolase [Gammaproteobacteria bacterium]
MTALRIDSQTASVQGPAGPLEAVIDTSPGGVAAVAVVCHPHPLQGGTLHNKVTHTVARAFARLGAAAVRFNFRGVGQSAGAYDDGRGERADLAAVAAWCRERWPGKPLYLGGFSFGGAVALAEAAALEPQGLVAVAPATRRIPSPFTPPACPWLVVQGDRDDVVPLAETREWLAAVDGGGEMAVLPGAGHFFHGKLPELAERVREFLEPLLVAERRGAAGAR